MFHWTLWAWSVLFISVGVSGGDRATFVIDFAIHMRRSRVGEENPLLTASVVPAHLDHDTKGLKKRGSARFHNAALG
jgi:hypothetical protein